MVQAASAISGTPFASLAPKETESSRQGGSGFQEIWESLEKMNEMKVQTDKTMSNVVLGLSENTHGALIAAEKLNLQAQLFVSVRDKGLQAYNQVLNMQI